MLQRTQELYDGQVKIQTLVNNITSGMETLHTRTAETKISRR